VKFAIHILSVVVNSAGCERVFSRFGITHTKRRSRLSLEKVRKTAVVKMDLQRAHVEAGLIHRHGKRKLGATFEPEESPSTTTIPSSTHTTTPGPTIPIPAPMEEDEESEGEGEDEDEDDISDFDELTQELIAAAKAADEDDDDEVPVTPTSSSAPMVPGSPITIRIPARKTLVPLKDLFIYPSDPTHLQTYNFTGKVALRD
jgi:hypothetical protein